MKVDWFIMSWIGLHILAVAIFGITQNNLTLHHKTWSSDTSLNISTEDETMSDKKLSYVQWHSSQQTQFSGMKLKKIISYWCLKIQKHSVIIGLPAAIFLFMNILTDNLFMHFFTFKTPKCVSAKRFYTNTCFLP